MDHKSGLEDTVLDKINGAIYSCVSVSGSPINWDEPIYLDHISASAAVLLGINIKALNKMAPKTDKSSLGDLVYKFSTLLFVNIINRLIYWDSTIAGDCQMAAKETRSWVYPLYDRELLEYSDKLLSDIVKNAYTNGLVNITGFRPTAEPGPLPNPIPTSQDRAPSTADLHQQEGMETYDVMNMNCYLYALKLVKVSIKKNKTPSLQKLIKKLIAYGYTNSNCSFAAAVIGAHLGLRKLVKIGELSIREEDSVLDANINRFIQDHLIGS
jgi:hypothetical protein